jgi:phosphoethanolamine N-methyltransferase
VVWSRETLLHVPDKPSLFQKFHRWLSPGGALVITDYARRKGRGSDRFESYVEASGYPLPELDRYAGFLTDAGFADVSVEDRSETLADLLREGLDKLEANKEEFRETFSAEDYDYLKERWQLKLDCCRDGDMKWGWFKGYKPKTG